MAARAEDAFDETIKPLLKKYCVECHSGDDANGDVDFTEIQTTAQAEQRFELWESVVELVNDGMMPPEDELQPSESDKRDLAEWFQREFVSEIVAHPGEFRPRRLSAIEYRNTLHSLIGFSLDVAIVEAEQTVAETSLVMKLLPTDPPGRSGFTNDTSSNPLTTVIWDQYSYLVDVALDRLFSMNHRSALEAYTGPIEGEFLTQDQAVAMIRSFTTRAYRRPPDQETIELSIANIRGLSGESLSSALRHELKTVLMSPSFIYRGLLMEVPRDEVHPVDDHELAERLSYFLWADMPDAELMQLAGAGQLSDATVFREQVDRMLASPKARSLAEVMAAEWFSLNELDTISDNPPVADALKSQPIDFLHYLFTEARPLTELVDSDTTFINLHTARFYPGDRKQLKKYRKPKGIEVAAVPNQRIKLEQTSERGGLLTMPGVLAMNKGPILRGTWILERILGQHLPDPPPDVGQVAPNQPGEDLTFRQRFEMHRSNPTCAVCHDKIDPLGFALEAYDSRGAYLRSDDYTAMRLKLVKGDRRKEPVEAERIDTRGQLPSGESFEDFAGLQQILVTGQRSRLIRNIVRRTMSYALCRKLEPSDRPTVESIVRHLEENNGTFEDLFHQIAGSLPFRQTVVTAATSESP